MAEDARQSSAESAKESQNLLIQSLTNRIIEGNQVQARSKSSVLEDIESVGRLLPVFQNLLGGDVSKMLTPTPAPEGISPPDAGNKPKS